MIVIELKEEDLNTFKKKTFNTALKYEIIESRKLGGDDIVFQIILTAISIASPYIIELFKSTTSTSKIIFIKDGIKYIFEKEEDLKKFLDSNS